MLVPTQNETTIHATGQRMLNQTKNRKKKNQLSGLSDDSANSINIQRQPSNRQTRNFVRNC